MRREILKPQFHAQYFYFLVYAQRKYNSDRKRNDGKFSTEISVVKLSRRRF